MRQFVGLALAFILLPVILKVYPKVFKGKKAPLGPILILTGLIIALVGGLPFGKIGDSFVRVFTTFSTLQTLIVVVEIGVLGSILKKYGILERIVRALEQLIPSKKALIMILPGIMGMLPVPGGAFLSAPFVDQLGTELKMSGEQKSGEKLQSPCPSVNHTNSPTSELCHEVEKVQSQRQEPGEEKSAPQSLTERGIGEAQAAG